MTGTRQTRHTDRSAAGGSARALGSPPPAAAAVPPIAAGAVGLTALFLLGYRPTFAAAGLVAAALAYGVLRRWSRRERSYARATLAIAASFAAFLLAFALGLPAIYLENAGRLYAFPVVATAVSLVFATLLGGWMAWDARRWRGAPDSWPGVEVDERRHTVRPEAAARAGPSLTWLSAGLGVAAAAALRTVIGEAGWAPLLMFGAPLLLLGLTIPFLARALNLYRALRRLERQRGCIFEFGG